MFDAQHAKRPENDQTQTTPAQKTSGTKQRPPHTADPTRIPRFTQAWGNLPPPRLRQGTLQQSPTEQLLQRQAKEAPQHDLLTQQLDESGPAQEQSFLQRREPTRMPLYTQAWGNQPQPWLRLPIQRKDPHEEASLQGEEEPTQRKENHTGLPDTLKAGVESLSGIAMDDVKVHYNSDKPAKVGALAYTQGTDIHVAPGQEKHLPHEAWHVVQQAQGRVQPTTQVKDVAVNDEGLEREADVMGGRIPFQSVSTGRDSPASEENFSENGSTVIQARWVQQAKGKYVWVDDPPSETIKVQFLDGVKGLTVQSAKQWLKAGGIILEGGPEHKLHKFLYESNFRNTYGFLRQDAFKASLLQFNAQEHVREQTELLRSVVQMSDWIVRNYPPDEYIYIGLGRSPGAIIAYLQSTCPGNTFSVPLSSFRPGPGDKWSILYDAMTSPQKEWDWTRRESVFKEKPTPGLNKNQQEMLKSHFDEFIPKIPRGIRVLLIDYTQGAQSLIAAQHYLQKYLTAQGSESEVFALAMHEERHKYDIQHIYNAIATPKSKLWNPMDSYYHTDARKRWGERFRPLNLGQNEVLSEAFRRELFDDFSEFGSYKLLEEQDRPRKFNFNSEETTAYEVLKQEVIKASSLNPDSVRGNSSGGEAQVRGSQASVGMDANVADLPGRIFGEMAAQIENAINTKELSSVYTREQAEALRKEFRQYVDKLILSSIADIDRNPQEAEQIVGKGIVFMQNLIRRFC